MKKLINLLLKIVVITIIITICLYIIPNKSNINKYYIIPLISYLFVKYAIGDIDKGSKYSFSDIWHLLLIMGISILFIKIFDMYS